MLKPTKIGRAYLRKIDVDQFGTRVQNQESDGSG